MSMIHDITAAVGPHKRSQRKGRGRSSNRGKTCGRGGKGSSARQGSPHWVPGHEGGQTKLFQRFPKRGFSNENFERRFYTVNVSELSRFESGATVDASALVEAGLVPDDRQPVKILGDGTLSKKLTIVAAWYSKSAFEKITKAGGAAQNLEGETFEFPKPKKKFIPREGGKKPAKKGEAPAGESAKDESSKDQAKAGPPDQAEPAAKREKPKSEPPAQTPPETPTPQEPTGE